MVFVVVGEEWNASSSLCESRSTEPIQRQQSHELPSQCSDSKGEEYGVPKRATIYLKKLLKDQMNDFIQKDVAGSKAVPVELALAACDGSAFRYSFDCVVKDVNLTDSNIAEECKTKHFDKQIQTAKTDIERSSQCQNNGQDEEEKEMEKWEDENQGKARLEENCEVVEIWKMEAETSATADKVENHEGDGMKEEEWAPDQEDNTTGETEEGDIGKEEEDSRKEREEAVNKAAVEEGQMEDVIQEEQDEKQEANKGQPEGNCEEKGMASKADDGETISVEQADMTDTEMRNADLEESSSEDSQTSKKDAKQMSEKNRKPPKYRKETIDLMKKFEKIHGDKSSLTGAPILRDASYKVKSAMNASGDNSNKAGGANQGGGGNGQASSRPGNARFHRAKSQKIGGNGNEEDDDDNKKRRPTGSDDKRLDCDRLPKRRKAARKNKRPNSSSSPPPSSAHGEEFASVPSGGGPYMRARGPQGDVVAARCDPIQNLGAPAPRGAPNQREPPRFVNDEVEVLKQMQQLSLHSAGNRRVLGPAGDAKQSRRRQLLTKHLLSCPLPTKRIPRTSHNVEVVKKFYKDDGVIVPHRSLRGYAGNGPQEVPMGGAIGGEAGQGDLQSPKDPQPMDVNQDIDIPPGVSHGHPGILAAYANQLQREKHLNFSELQGRHDGVLLDQELKPGNGQYREDEQYTKMRFLGKGSFGDVYLIQDKTSKKKAVAKRVITENFQSSEPVLCANLSHPNIVGFLGLVRTDDMVLLLFKYYGPCQTLQELVDQNVLGQGRVLRLIEQLLDPLKYLHGKRIVHKDIKPDNVLIYAGDRIQLIDFGLAMRLLTPQHTDDALKGTECYMAPEIAGSRPYDERVDVWSAICTLICLISKHPPWAQRFKGIPIKIFIISTREAPLEDIPAGTDPRVRQFIESVLVKDFQQRPTAAQALELLPCNIISELYNTPAISVDQEPEPEPMVHGIPDNFFPGPVTPQTPRGPHEEACNPFLPQNLNPQEDRSASDLLSSFYLTNEDETGNNASPETPATAEMESPSGGHRQDSDAKMEVDDTEEDMYGPTMDTEGPEVFNEGAFNQQDSRVVNGARPRDGGGDSASNSAKPPNKSAACNFGQPVLGRQTSRIDPPVNGLSEAPRVGPQVNVDQAHSQLLDQPPVVDPQVLGAVQARVDSLSNSQATRSFMQDEAEEFESPSSKSGQEKILGDPSVSASFELGDMLPDDKASSEHTSWKTAFTNMMDAGRFSSEDDGYQDQTDYGGAPGRGNVTSGFDSNSPRDSAEEGKGRPLEPPAGKLERTSEMPAGIYVTVSVEGCEAIKVKIDLDYTVVQVAKLVVRLPNFENAQMMARPFSLRLEGEEEPLPPRHTFCCGEHFLVAVAAPDGGNWLWRIDKSGHVTSALGV